MRFIPQQKIENNGTNIDIFAYFRSYYSSTNLSGDGIVSVKPSTTSWGNESLRTGPSNLISEPDGFRWCCNYGDSNPKLEIMFHSNCVTLFSYTIESFKNYRYIKSWNVFGISNKKKYLLDSRKNETVFGAGSTFSVFANFTCQHIGTFNKFSIELVDLDSLGEKLLSMSSIQFYGIVNPYNYKQTCYLVRKTQSKVALIIYLLILGS